MSSGLNVGDRVRVTLTKSSLYGKEGVVIRSLRQSIKVRMDEDTPFGQELSFYLFEVDKLPGEGAA